MVIDRRIPKCCNPLNQKVYSTKCNKIRRKRKKGFIKIKIQTNKLQVV